jgi:hypothetical protein
MKNDNHYKNNIELKIMSYLDGELDEQESHQIEQLIRKDKQYRQTYESLKKVQEATRGMKLKKLPEFYWDEYWQHVYNRIERGFSWIFISLGAIIVMGFLSWSALNALFSDKNLHPFMKVGILLLAFGLLVLLVSVVREKLMIRKVDKYREVER